MSVFKRYKQLPLSPAETGTLAAMDANALGELDPIQGDLEIAIPQFFNNMSEEELADRGLHSALIKRADFQESAIRRAAISKSVEMVGKLFQRSHG